VNRPSDPSKPSWTPEALGLSPNPLARHYSRFRVEERLLLTGHSHQAWPDVGFEGQVGAWADAAELVDDKWGRAEHEVDRVRHGFARLLGDPSAVIALGQNTHELVVRFLSSLPLRARPRLVTTDGEFHTLRRQLDRIAEEGTIEVVKVGAEPASAIAERLAREIDDRTAAVLVSSVLYANARIVPGLGLVARACRQRGAELLVDAYHQLNVLPFSFQEEGLEEAFIVGGGYKYCQLGEGNCFLRVPPGREELRPLLTGWFSEFEHLAERRESRVSYGPGSARWAGATYDPTSHYRAARVFGFFEEQGLTPELLRAVSRRQIRLLTDHFDSLGLDPRRIARDRSVPLEEIGGFLALQARRAGELSAALRSRGVWTDSRGDLLRLGPAPYLSDEQLEAAIGILGEALAGERAGLSP
jgi:kynureninase